MFPQAVISIYDQKQTNFGHQALIKDLPTALSQQGRASQWRGFVWQQEQRCSAGFDQQDSSFPINLQPISENSTWFKSKNVQSSCDP